jgi:hypothetical protein
VNPLEQVERDLVPYDGMPARARVLGIEPFVFEVWLNRGSLRSHRDEEVLNGDRFCGRLWAVLLVLSSLRLRGQLPRRMRRLDWPAEERAAVDDFIALAAQRCAFACVAGLDEGWAVDFAGALLAAFGVADEGGGDRVMALLREEAAAQG